MSKAKLAQAKASLDSAQGHINQNAAMLRHAADVLSKTQYEAPFDGIITNVPVREGETVVPGIQNSPGSTLMTIGDTSIITAEVKVDESDIVNVQLGQPAEVTIDAMPKQKFKGVVTEIGRNALLRSTGVSTAQSTSSGQEAKDFKVVVALQDPPAERASRTFGDRAHHHREARQRTGDSDSGIDDSRARRSGAGEQGQEDRCRQPVAATSGGRCQRRSAGVFVIRNKKDAVFVPVTTGISGTTDIEVNSGLKEGDEIVTGSYKVLRTLAQRRQREGR